MKKIICIVFLLSGACGLSAQELDMAKAFIVANQFDKGKEGIDKFLAKPANANNAEAIYYKAYLYNAMANQASKPLDEAIALNKESYSAIKRYRELDPKEKFTKDEENRTVYNNYYSFYGFGAKAYNAKNYDQSFANFKDALEVHDYIYANKLTGPKALNLTFSSLDTEVIWNLAILANELKRPEDVAAYYKKIVDSDLKDPKYLEAYENLALYYSKAKDQVLFSQYVEKGKRNFPGEQFWEQLEIQNSTDGVSGEALLKRYDELTTKYPNSYAVWFYYGNALDKFVNADENKNADLTTYKNKIPETIKRAIAIDNTAEANLFLAINYYNNSFDLSEEASKIKGTKPDDIKKRNELNAASKKALDDSAPYAEAVTNIYGKQATLKSIEKNSYRRAYDMLIEIYRVKGDLKKSAEYKAKKDAIQ